MLSTIVLIVCAIIALLAIYMLIRNNMVYKFRTTMLNSVSDAAKKDILKGQPWDWRYAELKAVSYEECLYSLKKLDVGNFWDRDPARSER
jgi:hypothetical protein